MPLSIRPPACTGLTFALHRRPMTAGRAERRGQREQQTARFRRSIACARRVPRLRRSARPGAGCLDGAFGESCQGPIVTPTSKSAGECVAEARGGTPLPIGARLGDFEVTGVIHEDESSVIYVAADRSSMGKVAIKEYLPARLAERMANGNVGVRSLRHKQAFRDGMQRFLSEARMLAALDEPALIEVLRSWEQNGTAYMAMPLYEGRTLKDVLRDSPRPREAWLKTMFGPLLDALATSTGPVAVRAMSRPTISWCSLMAPLCSSVSAPRRASSPAPPMTSRVSSTPALRRLSDTLTIHRCRKALGPISIPLPRCSIWRLPANHPPRRQREWSRTPCRR